jgi:hypothetical protein
VKVEIETEKAEKPTTKEKLSFGFKGTEAKLKSVITLLNNQVEFLNEEVNVVPRPFSNHSNIKGTYYQNAQSVFRLRNSAA